MPQGYLSHVHEFVQRQNRAEVEGCIEDLAPLIQDEHYLYAEKSRLDRIRQSERQRDVKKIRNEVKLRITDTEQAMEHIKLNFCLHRQNYYELQGKLITEERIQEETMLLQPTSAGWQIIFCSTAHPEKTAPVHTPALQARSHHSVPFLHPAVLPRHSASNRKKPYDRIAAVQYAEQWWNMGNPEFKEFTVDCTNYVSQCLYAGDIPMDYTSSRDQGWWYRQHNKEIAWSYSWSVAHSLRWSLSDPKAVFRAEQVALPEQLEPGDVILYDWDGNGKVQHSTIVTAKDSSAMPLVNAHTQNSRHRYWDYHDSYAWTPSTKYHFFHLSSH